MLVITGALFIAKNTLFDNDSPVSQTPKPTVTTTPKTATNNMIRLVAMGDMLPHDTVNQQARTSNGYSYAPMFDQVAPYIKSGALVFCNQEAPSAPGFGVSGYPTFNAPTAFAQDLNGLGCNLINLANNHANDKGQSGIDQTRQVWDSLPTLAVAGTARSQTEQDKIAYFTKQNVRFAFLSYSKCSNDTDVTSYGLNMLDRELVAKQVAQAKANADMIIVGTHWCRENVSSEDADQTAWSEYLASQGADIVIGTGPHVLQPVKRLPKAGGGETVVWYSLGNFLSTQEQINGLIGGIAYMDINAKTHAVDKLSFLPTYMHYEWTAQQKAAGDLLARKNLKLYLLDKAAEPLSRSQNETTAAAQTTRVTSLLNTYTKVDILTSATAPKR